MGGFRSFLQRRVVDPVLAQLRLGVTPRKLALSLALGVVVSVMPVLGITALVAVALGALLRLNQPAILAANYAAYPLQIALFLPFFQAGAWITRGPPVSVSLAQIRAEMAEGLWATIARYSEANLRALAAWAIVAVPATLLLAFLLRPLLARLPIPRDPEPPRPARGGGVPSP
jgi:uncharacterized protein (DUF2062 family)